MTHATTVTTRPLLMLTNRKSRMPTTSRISDVVSRSHAGKSVHHSSMGTSLGCAARARRQRHGSDFPEDQRRVLSAEAADRADGDFDGHFAVLGADVELLAVEYFPDVLR